MISEAIIKIVDKKDLTYGEAYAVISEIMEGKTSATQNAAFLAALSTKNTNSETEDEIAGCAYAMRNHSAKVDHPYDVFEIVGTGGDHSGTFNISTVSSFVVAASGTKVAMHGDRAVSSASGSADCLEALDVNIHQNPSKAAKLLDDPGICFLFAPDYHGPMKYVEPLRKELGIRTVFNILGPLTNPAAPRHMVLGVYSECLVTPLAHVLSKMGVRKGMVVYGQDRMDVLSCSAPTTVCDFEGDDYNTFTTTPNSWGLPMCDKSEILGGTPAENAKIAYDIFKGRKGPRYNAVLLNAGAGLYVSGRARDMKDGVELADKLLSDGKVSDVFERFRKASNQ